MSESEVGIQDAVITAMGLMKVGDHINVYVKIRHKYYSFAKKAGIKITIRSRIYTPGYGCWRIKDED